MIPMDEIKQVVWEAVEKTDVAKEYENDHLNLHGLMVIARLKDIELVRDLAFIFETSPFSLPYSGVHKRSDAYSNLLSKPQLLSMTWQTFKTLQPPWQSGSKQILIGGFQKCKTCPCASRGYKVTGCQSLSASILYRNTKLLSTSKLDHL